MKLLTKTSLLIITISIFIFLVGNIVFFNVARQMINKHVDTDLIYRMHKAINDIKTANNNDFLYRYSDDVEIKPIEFAAIRKPSFSDTVIYSSIQKKFIPNRTLTFTFPHNNINYQMVIYKSLLSSDKLVEQITISSIIMFLTFALIIYILNQFVFGTVWANFFSNLKKVENYDIKSKTKLELEDSEIDEFAKLNTVLMQMVNRIQTDFENLKELTANTSHEIQTPLAIIKSKSEILMQSPNLSEDDLNALASIMNTTERLSKLNQSLLLITKIENDQYADASKVNFVQTIEKLVSNFEIIYPDRRINVECVYNEYHILANSVLIDVLLSNLIKNAFIHGTHDSEISIEFGNHIFMVKNLGEPLKFNPDEIFTRFVKGSHDKTSSGLGLAIVNKICDYYGLSIVYNFIDAYHSFTINFSKIKVNE